MVKRIIKKQKPELMYVVDSETGELREINPVSISVMSEEYEVISYEDYIYYNCAATTWLLKHLSVSERDRLTLLSLDIAGEHNILYSGKSKPHTLDSIAERLNLDKPRASTFMKKLKVLNIVATIYIKRGRKTHKKFILNPFYARKRKMFHVDCINLFTQRFKS